VSDPERRPGRRELVRLVVVTYNSAQVLPGLLASLPDACKDVPATELVVADNASRDTTLEILADLAPHTQVIRTGGNLGYAAAINRAAAAPSPFGWPYDALLVLNPDIRLAPGAVARMLEAVGGTVGIVVPRLTDPDGSLIRTLRRRPTVLRALGESVLGGDRAGRYAALGEVVQDPAAYRTGRDVDWASGACMLITAACAARVGPWDESFLLYSEETDFQLRAGDAGFRVRYTPEAHGVHIGGEAHVRPWLWSLLTTNRVKLYRKRNGRAATAAFWAAVTAGEALRALQGRAPARAALAALVNPARRIRELPA
jgi:N-acetylglucosaminyl-diphospho-decaprenol L-rhamnosyltransferase